MGMDAATLLVRVGVDLTGFDSGLREVDKRLGAAAKRADTHAGRMSGAFSRAFKNMAAYGGLASIGLAIGGVAKNSMNLEKTLSSLGAVSGASGRQMQAFKKAAVDASLATKFSSVDAAQAMVELAKGGVKVTQIGGALQGTLSMAAAGGIDVADAARAAANAMNLFGINGKHVTHVADAFAQAANSTTADIGDFAMALSQGGGVAKMAGLSFDQTVVALEALAKAGIKNSDAGTSLKNSILALLTPSKQQSKIMKEYGLSFVNSNGHVKDAAQTADMLRDKLSGLTKAQRTNVLSLIAGSDGVRALGAMYDAGGKQIRGWQNELTKSGTAAAQAAKMQDNTAAKLQKLEHSALAAGGVFVDAFIPGLQHGADAVSKFLGEAVKSGDLDRLAQKAEHAASTGISALTSAAHTAAPALSALQSAAGKIGAGPLLASLAGFKIGGAIAGDLGGMASKFKVARAAGGGFGKSLVGMAGGANIAAAGIAVLAGTLVYLSSKESTAAETARQLRDAVLGADAAANGSKDASRGVADAMDRQKDATLGVERAHRDYASTVKQSGKNSLDAREAHQRLSEAIKEQKRADEDLNGARQKHAQSINDERDAQRALADQIALTTRRATQAGSAAGLNGAARGIGVSMDAQRAQTAAIESAARAYDSLASKANGAPGPVRAVAASIAAYIRQTHLIPDSKTTRLFLTGAGVAESQIAAIATHLSGLRDKTVLVKVLTDISLPGTSRPGPTQKPPKKPPPKGTATGGINSNGRVFGGRGGDSVDAILAPGEDVVNAHERRMMKAGVPYDQAMQRGGAVMLAKGGAHQPRTLDQFLGNALLNRLSHANSTLGTADDRLAAKAAVSQLKNILKHKIWHGKPISQVERREMWDALGQFKNQALKPDRSADEFLSAKTKADIALAHSTIHNEADDRHAASEAVRDLEKALKGKLSAAERNTINDALGGFRTDAENTTSNTPPAEDPFATQRIHDEGVREGLGRSLSYILGGSGDIGTGTGGNALGSAGTIVVQELHLVNSTQNQSAVARANNAGADTLYRGRMSGSRIGVT